MGPGPARSRVLVVLVACLFTLVVDAAVNVLAAGAPRSGSTELYNLARLIALSKDPNALYGWYLDQHGSQSVEREFQYWRNKTFVVMKCHELKNEWIPYADVILFSHREPQAAVCSFALMFHPEFFDDEHTSCANWMTICKRYGKLKAMNYEMATSIKDGPRILDLPFEELVMEEHLRPTTMKIARAMGVDDLDDDDLEFVTRSMQRLTEFPVTNDSVGHVHHPFTLFHGHHAHTQKEKLECDDFLSCFETEETCRTLIAASKLTVL